LPCPDAQHPLAAWVGKGSGKNPTGGHLVVR
jgi:hypothetical protein